MAYFLIDFDNILMRSLNVKDEKKEDNNLDKKKSIKKPTKIISGNYLSPFI